MLAIVIVIAILIGVGIFVWRDWSVIASHNKTHIATIQSLVTKIADPAPTTTTTTTITPASPASQQALLTVTGQASTAKMYPAVPVASGTGLTASH